MFISEGNILEKKELCEWRAEPELDINIAKYQKLKWEHNKLEETGACLKINFFLFIRGQFGNIWPHEGFTTSTNLLDSVK